METVNLRSSTSWAKIIGTLESISGAFVVAFSKGPPITRMKPMSTPSYGPFRASESNWVIGVLLLTAEHIMIPLWFIIQADIIEYPSELVGIVGSVSTNAASAWVIHLKGPVYVAMFQTLAIGTVLVAHICFIA
ncbi:hypothetical protein RJ641_022719, partial [Dillenia turbinata]